MRGYWLSVGVWGMVLGIWLWGSGCATPPPEVPESLSPELSLSAQSLLKRADQLFQQRRYEEAAEAYRTFLELHPTHPQAPEAQYRLGLCAYRRIDTVDRDLQPAQEALEAFQTLIRLYPQSAFLPQARKYIQEIRILLAEREVYVGRFYYRKGSCQAAIARFQRVVERYGDTPSLPAAHFYWGACLAREGDREGARQHWEAVLSQAPETPWARKARKALTRLQEESPG